MSIHKIAYFSSEEHFLLSYFPCFSRGSGHYAFALQLNKMSCDFFKETELK